jgi:hypothetical protein
LRCVIFDRHNSLFTKEIRERFAKSNPEEPLYFNQKLSFYSDVHGGTFHFLQFNVMHASEFLKSNAFTAVSEFLKKTFPSDQ